jgi:hypothetical protein
LYIGENNAMWPERGHGTDLDLRVLDMMMSKLSSDPVSDDSVNPSPSCMPIFMDLAARLKLLKVMPTLDDMDIIVKQVGDTSQGVQIHRTDAADSHWGAGTNSSSSMGKEKVVTTGPAPKAGSWSPSRNVGALIGLSASPEKKRRLVRGDESSVTEPALEGQQAQSKAAVE